MDWSTYLGLPKRREQRKCITDKPRAVMHIEWCIHISGEVVVSRTNRMENNWRARTMEAHSTVQTPSNTATTNSSFGGKNRRTA